MTDRPTDRREIRNSYWDIFHAFFYQNLTLSYSFHFIQPAFSSISYFVIFQLLRGKKSKILEIKLDQIEKELEGYRGGIFQNFWLISCKTINSMKSWSKEN